jgi:hypothetical protein
MVPDFDAETKFPYGSRVCLHPVAVGHNLIHRICEEVDKCGAHQCIVHTLLILPKNTAAPISRLNSITLIRIKVFAHNLFHKICAESPGRQT